MTVTNEKVVKGKMSDCNKGNQNCEMRKGASSNRGFSLVELIIVIAIMAVLVGILTPQYLSYMHRARVAADWANLKNYYTEIQADFITTGKVDPEIYKDLNIYDNWRRTEIHFLSGQTVKLKAGYYAVTMQEDGYGYQIAYYCNECDTDFDKHKDTCVLVLN